MDKGSSVLEIEHEHVENPHYPHFTNRFWHARCQYWHFRGARMSVPSFHDSLGADVHRLRQLIADRVRLERRRRRLTQKEFASFCGVALRTYKRFESGTCDSLEAFLSIVVAFERVVALELLFPPKETAELKPRGPEAALEALRARVEREQLDTSRFASRSLG